MSSLLAIPLLAALAANPDTVRLEVGSPEVDGRVYGPHAARVRVYTDAGGATPVAEWTNELTLGDSAGRRVMRWVTKRTGQGPDGRPVRWELRQTYDARTLAPYGYSRTRSRGRAPACYRTRPPSSRTADEPDPALPPTTGRGRARRGRHAHNNASTIRPARSSCLS